MKKLIALSILFAIGLVAEEYVRTGNPFTGFYSTPYLKALDWKTNTVEARTWLALSTNSTITRRFGVVHTVYPSCDCAECNGRVFDKTTTVWLHKMIESGGTVGQLSVQQVWSTNETIVVQ